MTKSKSGTLTSSGVAIYSHYSPPPKKSLVCADESRTVQSEKDACDVNNIISSFVRTGEWPANARGRAMQYGDFSNVPDLLTAHERIQEANALFMELPAKLRSRFENNPFAFIDYCQDPKNEDELINLGLATKRVIPSQKKSEAGVPGPDGAPQAGAPTKSGTGQTSST